MSKSHPYTESWEPWDIDAGSRDIDTVFCAVKFKLVRW